MPAILMDKGIVIGVDYETSTRSLPFNLFKIQTGTHLFLPQFMRYHLSNTSGSPLHRALTFASNYSSIVYFAHSLEILLHSVLEDELDNAEVDNPGAPGQLRRTIEFLDHFPEAMDVVVGCARKTEVDRWEKLFAIVGSPRELFERCLELGKWRTAASYLLVLQNLEELDDAKVSYTLCEAKKISRLILQDAIRLLRLAIEAKEYHLSKELLRFLHSIDESGAALRQAIADVGIVQGEGQQSAPTFEISQPPRDPSQRGEVPGTAAPPSQASYSETSLGATPNLSSRSSQVSSPDPNIARLVQIRNVERVSSPFQLSSPRLYESPPSPKTVMVGAQAGSPMAVAGQGRMADAPQVPEHEDDGDV